MKPEQIDRALREDDPIAVSGDFTHRVMQAVREEAADRGPLRFPWWRTIPGIAACVAALFVAVVAGPPADPELLVNFARSVPARAIGAAVAPLVGSWLLARISFRICGYRP